MTTDRPADAPVPAPTIPVHEERGSSNGSVGEPAARVLVLTRVGCHLCDEAVAVVEAVCAQTGDTWTTRDVDTDPALRRRFTDEVPVTFVDGAQHDYWRVDPVRLRAALTRTGPRPS